MPSTSSFLSLGCTVASRRKMVRMVFYLAFATFCFLAFSEASFAQSTFGTVLGTVRDPSGSLIPGAMITLLNTGTNAEHTALRLERSVPVRQRRGWNL